MAGLLSLSMLRNYWHTALLLLPFFAGRAQLPSALKFTSYSEATAAAAGNATCFLQGRDGYLWFGTSNGLLRFDGYNFQPYFNTASFSNTINHLAEDKRGNIWMSFLSGEIARFDPFNCVFTNYKLHNDKDAAIGGGEVTTLFFDSSNQLWAGVVQKGLLKADVEKNSTTVYRVGDEQSALYAPALRSMYNTVYAIMEDGDRLWLATHDGLYRFIKSTGRLSSIREKQTEKEALRRDLYNSILPDDDSLWFGSWGGGLSCYNKKTGNWHHYPLNAADYKKGFNNIVVSVSAKSAAEIWICSHDRGLGVFNKASHTFYFFGEHPEHANIPGNEWSALTTDKEGNVWGLQGQGLVKVSIPAYKFLFTPFAINKGTVPGNFLLTDSWEDESLRLTATSYADGLHVYNKRTGKETVLKAGLLKKEDPVQFIRDIFEDSRHRLWIVSRDFIYQYDRLANTLQKGPQPPLYTADSLSDNFNYMAEDKNGRLWLATRRSGLYVWDEATQHFLHAGNTKGADIKLPFNNVVMMEPDRHGRMWLTSMDGELSYINTTTFQLTKLPAVYGNGMKMPGSKAFGLHRDGKGNMWVGTFSGLYYFTCDKGVPQLEKVFRGADGLRSDLVYSIHEDRHGNVWCISDATVCLLPNGTGPVQSFGTADGLLKGNPARIVALGTDSLLLLHYGGNYRLRPADFFSASKQYPLVITAMQVADKPFYYKDGLQKEGTVHLAADQNFFSFEFAALNYTSPEKEQYFYQLKGVDKDWIAAGSRRFVSYTNIPGGRYMFRVKSGMNAVSSAITELPLFISTPYYKTFWFYASLVILVGSSLYAFLRYRLKQQTKVYHLHGKTQLLEKEKALVLYEGLKQQLNPHFLFNSLTSLNSLIVSEPKKAKQFLEQMSKIYRYILKSRDHEVVPLGDELKFVQTYISLQQTRFKEDLAVNTAIDESYHYCKIVPVTLQNLIENAIKHNIINEEQPLRIDLFAEDGYLLVRNNLQKKKVVEGSNRQGLKSMKTLYRYLTAKPLIIEETGESFIVKIPLIE